MLYRAHPFRDVKHFVKNYANRSLWTQTTSHKRRELIRIINEAVTTRFPRKCSVLAILGEKENIRATA